MLTALQAKGPLVTQAQPAISPSPLTEYVLTVFYVDANYGGAELTVYTDLNNYCASYSLTENSMPSGWNDVISSYHSYAGCKTRVSENINQGGAYYGPVVNAATLGVMNDATSSFWITG